MGTGTSPILFEKLVIVQCDEENGESSFIVALDKTDGQGSLATPRKVQVSWATPILVRRRTRGVDHERNGVRHLLRSGTGKELWRHKGVESNAIPSPVRTTRWFLSSPVSGEDRDGDQLGGSGDLTGTPNVPWKYAKGTAYVPSPILYGDYLYLTTDRGILTCIDAKTGEVKYEGGRIPIPATFTASPVAFEGKDPDDERGRRHVYREAGPKHEVIGTNSSANQSTLRRRSADGRIFIRGRENLYCIGQLMAGGKHSRVARPKK
jgi:hypothetical protein